MKETLEEYYEIAIQIYGIFFILWLTTLGCLLMLKAIYWSYTIPIISTSNIQQIEKK